MLTPEIEKWGSEFFGEIWNYSCYPPQVDDGRPVMHKFSKATADATSLNGSPTPEWSFVCNGSGKNCNILDGSFKSFRVYKDAGVEKVVAVPVRVNILRFKGKKLNKS